MRLGFASSLASLVAVVAGLMTYEVVALVLAAAALLLGCVNLARLGRQAKDIKSLQEGQGRRLDDLGRPGED